VTRGTNGAKDGRRRLRGFIIETVPKARKKKVTLHSEGWQRGKNEFKTTTTENKGSGRRKQSDRTAYKELLMKGNDKDGVEAEGKKSYSRFTSS